MIHLLLKKCACIGKAKTLLRTVLLLFPCLLLVPTSSVAFTPEEIHAAWGLGDQTVKDFFFLYHQALGVISEKAYEHIEKNGDPENLQQPDGYFWEDFKNNYIDLDLVKTEKFPEGEAELNSITVKMDDLLPNDAGEYPFSNSFPFIRLKPRSMKHSILIFEEDLPMTHENFERYVARQNVTKDLDVLVLRVPDLFNVDYSDFLDTSKYVQRPEFLRASGFREKMSRYWKAIWLPPTLQSTMTALESSIIRSAATLSVTGMIMAFHEYSSGNFNFNPMWNEDFLQPFLFTKILNSPLSSSTENIVVLNTMKRFAYTMTFGTFFRFLHNWFEVSGRGASMFLKKTSNSFAARVVISGLDQIKNIDIYIGTLLTNLMSHQITPGYDAKNRSGMYRGKKERSLLFFNRRVDKRLKREQLISMRWMHMVETYNLSKSAAVQAVFSSESLLGKLFYNGIEWMNYSATLWMATYNVQYAKWATGRETSGWFNLLGKPFETYLKNNHPDQLTKEAVKKWEVYFEKNKDLYTKPIQQMLESPALVELGWDLAYLVHCPSGFFERAKERYGRKTNALIQLSKDQKFRKLSLYYSIGEALRTVTFSRFLEEKINPLYLEELKKNGSYSRVLSFMSWIGIYGEKKTFQYHLELSQQYPDLFPLPSRMPPSLANDLEILSELKKAQANAEFLKTFKRATEIQQAIASNSTDEASVAFLENLKKRLLLEEPVVKPPNFVEKLVSDEKPTRVKDFFTTLFTRPKPQNPTPIPLLPMASPYTGQIENIQIVTQTNEVKKKAMQGVSLSKAKKAASQVFKNCINYVLF